MNKKTIVALVSSLVIIVGTIIGCSGGDFKVTPVIKGQPAPHDGYTLSTEIYVEEGSTIAMSGVHIWIKGLDPNDILSEVD